MLSIIFCNQLGFFIGQVKSPTRFSNLLGLHTSDGVKTSLEITSISTTKVIIGKGMISKHVLLLIGLMSLVVPTSQSLCLNLKLNDVAHFALKLVPNFHKHKIGWFIFEIQKDGLVSLQLQFTNMFISFGQLHSLLDLLIFTLFATILSTWDFYPPKPNFTL